MSKSTEDLREAIEMWVELAVHKFHAAKGVVLMGDCTEESIKEIMQLIDQQRSLLLDELESGLPPEATEQYSPENSVFKVESYNEKTSYNIALDQVKLLITKLRSK